MKKILFNIFCISVMCIAIAFHVSAQTQGHYHYESAGNSTISLNNLSGYAGLKLKKGKVMVKMDLGEDYKYGSAASGASFNVHVDCQLKFLTTTYNQTLKFDLSSSNPEKLFVQDLSSFIDPLNMQFGLTFHDIELSRLTITGTSPMKNTAVVTLITDLDYGIDVSSQAVTGVNVSTISNASRAKHFSWTTSPVGFLFPDYEIQIMKLFNSDINTRSADDLITINDLDWSKALSFETQSSDGFIDLSLGEGRGWYVWRVRPIGTFYDGGIANNRNWGNWSSLPTVTAGFQVGYATVGTNPAFFFFEDPDADKNYIYSRTFTEGNKNQLEQISYANTLLQSKQTQVYLPSKVEPITIVSETFTDHLGRPTISTLPIPVSAGVTNNQGLSGYKSQFTLNQSGAPYRMDDFDYNSSSGASSFTPGEIKSDITQPYGYYSDVNPDDQIPDAGGYPFSEVLYESDGSTTVREKSGVGKRHMIGEVNNEMGRTVKTIYGTASQSELDNFFGDEAPLAENVFKTVTIDENNTASVTFTNKEGKVIATGLTFDDRNANSGNDVLDPASSKAQFEQQVEDVITTNIPTSDGFISTKRIVLLQSDNGKCTLKIDYQIDCPTMEGLCGGSINGDCNFTLEVKVFSVNDPVNPIYDYPPTLIQCNDSIQILDLTLDPGEYIVQKILRKSGIPLAVVNAIGNSDIQLTGITNWVTETLAGVNCDKELITFFNDLYVYVGLFHPNSSSTTTPTDLFTNYTGSGPYSYTLPSGSVAEFSPEFMLFYKNSFANLAPGYTGPRPFDIFCRNDAGALIDIYSANAPEVIPAYLEIHTPCCNVTVVRINYEPPFKCPSAQELVDFKNEILGGTKGVVAGNFSWANFDINPTYFDPTTASFHHTLIPDFEGYAIAMFEKCNESSSAAQDIFYKHMTGWDKPGMFNMMVYHMLTDVYNVNGYNNTSCSAPSGACGTAPSVNTTLDECADGANDQIYCTAYKCSDLAKCWTGLVRLLISTECDGGLDDLYMGTSAGISNGFDEQNSGNQSAHDDHVNDNFDLDIPWPFGWFMEMLMSDRFRDNQNISGTNGGAMPRPTLDVNLVEEFLNCTGYQFADILNGCPSPIQESNEYKINNTYSSTEACFLPLTSDFDNDKQNGEYNDFDFLNIASVSTHGFNTMQDWQNLPKCGSTGSEFLKKAFANVHNPIYAFKYFEYSYGSKQDMEFTTCFRDPNQCWDADSNIFVPCCKDLSGNAIPCNFCGFGYLTCNTTKIDWNSGQRYTFYSMLKNLGAPNYVNPSSASFPAIRQNCARLTTPSEWYPNISLTSNDPHYPNLPILSTQEFEDLYGVTYIKPSKVTLNSMTTFTLAEYDANQKNTQCRNDCDSPEKRQQFRSKLLQMFAARCYVIGGCKASNTDNVVPEEDIDALVDALVLQCQGQCNIKSVYCEDTWCRDINTPSNVYEYQVSHVPNADWCIPILPTTTPAIAIDLLNPAQFQVQGATNETTEFKYGVAGCTPSNLTCSYPTGTAFTFYTTRPAYPNDFPFGEYTLYLQAKEWDFDIDIESRCNSQGVYADGNTDHKVFDGTAWVDQLMDCTINNATSTVVDRTDYVKENIPIDPNHPYNPPVVSPSVTISVGTP